MAAYSTFFRLTPTYRGDAWSGFVATVNYPGFNWGGVTASCHLRKNPNSPALLSITPALAFPSDGVLTVTVALTGIQTATLPTGTIFGDVELSRVSPVFGPKTWIRFHFDVTGDITHG